MNLVVNAGNGGGSNMLQNIKLNIIVNAERGQDSLKFQEIKISMVVNARNGVALICCSHRGPISRLINTQTAASWDLKKKTKALSQLFEK